MPPFVQTNRPLQVTTPLGKDALLVTGFYGTEQLSTLFSVQIYLVAENTTSVDFQKLVGGNMTLQIAMPEQGGSSGWRYLNGICSSFSEGNRSERFTSYSAEVVPKVWLLTRKARSRIFQQKSVPDILKEVLKGFDCDWKLQGHYEPREYCVQYRETDFNFASRLMEEEGIYYLFKHTDSGHTMVVADSPQGHPEVPGISTVKFMEMEGGGEFRKGDHVFEWRKTQTLRSAKYVLWDHSFQQPKQNLEAQATILDSVQAGTVSHHLKGSADGSLELYDYPGGYAVRFDGVSPSGGDQPQRLSKILEDNKRTAKLRMEADTAQCLLIQGTSGCSNFIAGHKFTLDRHFDANGDYVLVSVSHGGTLGNPYVTGADSGEASYSNTFTCIPFQLAYRPQRITPRPFVHGVQNALVTGPSGEEIFTDKYGRVKVQFYWDREGKKDANSSCWLRVSSTWAGKQWGFIQIPRIGQEVLVAFLEGNPDEPVIVGSVWNPETMPTYALPGNKTRSGVQTRSSMGGGAANFNEIRFEDKKGSEELYVHAEKDQNNVVEHDETTQVGNDRTEKVGHDEKITIGNNRTEKVGVNEDITIGNNRTEKVGVNETITIGSNRTEKVGSNETITIGSNRTEQVGANESISVGGNRTRTVAQNEAVTVGVARMHTVGANEAITVGAAQEITVGAARTVTVGDSQTVSIGANLSEEIGGNHTESVAKSLEIQVNEDGAILVSKHLSLTGGEQIVLKSGDASITMKKDGSIEIKGKDIKIDGSGKIVATADSDMVLKGSSKVTIN
jgi:type VI secretion system secreted protein VgrG